MLHRRENPRRPQPPRGAVIRLARPGDADDIARIYAPIVRETAISFEIEPPPASEVARRVAATMATHPWLVHEHESTGTVTGYAYGSPFRSRTAYQWTVEVSAYVAEDSRGQGIARSLYTKLLSILVRQGFVTALAGIALPNAASVAFHEAMGFEQLGTYRNVGFKLGRWHDVGWWQRALRENPTTPDPPTPFGRLLDEDQEVP